MSLLEVNNISVCFRTRKGLIRAVNDVSFSVDSGKTLALVGESGSGKSVSAMSILRLLDENGYVERGEILFGEEEKTNLLQCTDAQTRAVRGNLISVIFQEPMTALNPVLTIEKQLSEPFIIHRKLDKKQAWNDSKSMLADVGIPNPERVLKCYPHELSGGMRQRVMIAMALACQPKLLIADEPTTALDVTIQAQILRLMKGLQEKNGAAILFITHDLGIVREMADDVAVMYCGEVVERVPAPVIFQKGGYSHPYTEGLLASLPGTQKLGRRLDAIPGVVPRPDALPKGCKFAPRCKYCTQKCVEEEPPLFLMAQGHSVRCYYAEKGLRRSENHAKLALG